MFTKNRQNPPGSAAGDLIYADSQTVQPKKKPDPTRWRRLAVAVIALTAVLTALTVAMTLGISVRHREERYVQAQALLEARDYAAAMAEFEALGDYRDSQTQFAALSQQQQAYAAASELLAQQRYDEAIAAFRALGDYADSAQRAAYDVTYKKALDLLEQTDAGQTQLLMKVLGSQARLTDDNGYPAIVGYEAAAALFESLEDYADAPDMAERCYLSAARVKLQWDDPTGALAYMEKLSEDCAAVLDAEYRTYLANQKEGQ